MRSIRARLGDDSTLDLELCVYEMGDNMSDAIVAFFESRLEQRCGLQGPFVLLDSPVAIACCGHSQVMAFGYLEAVHSLLQRFHASAKEADGGYGCTDRVASGGLDPEG